MILNYFEKQILFIKLEHNKTLSSQNEKCFKLFLKNLLIWPNQLFYQK